MNLNPILFAGALLAGCACEPVSSLCAPYDAVCLKLEAAAASLNSPEMEAAIAAARPGEPR